MRLVSTWLAMGTLIFGALLARAEDNSWLGKELASYLDYLNANGFNVIFSTAVVHHGLTISVEPVAVDSRSALSDYLKNYGLTIRTGPAGSQLIVRAEPSAAVAVQTQAEVLAPIPEVVVSASLHRLDRSLEGSFHYLDRKLASRLPATGEEAVRITDRLPGTASDGVSARNHVRGGEINEVLFLYDGLRLYEPYHFKDFQAISTIVNPNAISGIDYYTGAYPAKYGDRMSGAMIVQRREPIADLETELALSFFNASVLSMGRFGGDRDGDWLLTARRSNLDLIVDVIDPDLGSPDYQDYQAHVGWDFGPRARISLNMMISHDKLALNDRQRGEQASADYQNQLLWAKWSAAWSARLSSETLLAVTDIANARTGQLELAGMVRGSLQESSDFDVLELKQEWQWVLSPSWMWSFGLNVRKLDAHYQFESEKIVEPPFDRILDNQAAQTRSLLLDPAGAQYALYHEIRWRPVNWLTLDAGLRWDQQNYTTASDDRQTSPRLGILLEFNRRTALRIGWGQFYQAQEINELQVSDGVADFYPAQRAEHFVMNLRYQLGDQLEVELSAYDKHFRRVRPRFENIFDSLTLVPELQFDRVRIDADRGSAVGVELTLSKGMADDDLLWWVTYAWSRAQDEIAGETVMRGWDQSHTFKGGTSWRWGSWDFSAAAEVHTGWPKNELSGEMLAGAGGSKELALSVAGRNASRYADYHTVDVRISRDFTLARGELTAFAEVTNLFDRDNPCCTEYEVGANGQLAANQKSWPPLVPSLGIVWRF